MSDLSTADELFEFLNIDEEIHLHRGVSQWMVVQMQSEKCLDSQKCAFIRFEGPLVDLNKVSRRVA